MKNLVSHGCKIQILLSAFITPTAAIRSLRASARRPAKEPSTAISRRRRQLAEVIKVDVDLVTVDALVLQKKTARVVGHLKETDFVILEDGSKQEAHPF